MIVNRAGGTRGKTTSGTKKAAARFHIRHLLQYLSQEKKHGEQHTLSPLLTNLSSSNLEELEKELEAWKTLRPGITDPVRHKIFSPEKSDRPLTPADWQKMVDIYSRERGLGDAPYVAFLHRDGHGNRNPQHLHLLYLRIKSDGSPVPDSLDYKVDKRTARLIEKKLDLTVNKSAVRIYSTQQNSQIRRQRQKAGTLFQPKTSTPKPPRRADDQVQQGFEGLTTISARLIQAARRDATARQRQDARLAAAGAAIQAAVIESNQAATHTQATARRSRPAARPAGRPNPNRPTNH